MKPKIVFLAIFLIISNLTFGQVKFRVKKLNADSLVALIPDREGTELVDTELVEVLNILSNVICRKDIDSSILLATQAIKFSENLGYQKGLADGYFNIGNGYFLLDSLQPTISNYLTALRIYEDLEPSEEYGNLCMQLGLANRFSGRLEVAFQYIRQAQGIYNNINDKAGQAMTYQGLGVLKLMFYNESDSAIYYCNKALSFLDPTHDQTEVAYIYREIGNMYLTKFFENKDTLFLHEALSWHFKALNLPEIADEAKAFVYLNLGNTYLNFNSDTSKQNAIECYHKIIRIGDSCFDAYDLKSHVYEMLGWTYYIQGDVDKAIFNFNLGIKLIEERLTDFSINDFKEPVLAYNSKYYHKVNKQSIYDGLYSIYYELGDYKKALEYNDLSKEAEEAIFKEKNQNLITMLESISEDEKTEKQMALLAKDNELKELAIKQSRIYLFALAGFILILVLVALLFFRQRKIHVGHKVFVREQKLLHDLELKNVESEKLKELDSLKSQFFANISHEFRTPLTLILAPLEKLLSKAEDHHDKKELGIAKKYAGKLQILINNLLTISKLESGKMELHALETDVVKLVGTYIQSFESLAKQKNIDLQFTSNNKEIMVFIDWEKFDQVLNNLLSNAFKFTDIGGSIEIAVSSQQSTVSGLPNGKASSQSAVRDLPEGETGSSQTGDTEQSADRRQEAKDRRQKTEDWRLKTDNFDGQWVSIKISDTGRGIPPNHIGHIFDRFYQVGQEDNSYFDGTGIGLTLTKELVELHHGTIEVESHPGQGATFTVFLPLGAGHLKDEEIADQKIISNPVRTGSNIDLPETSNQPSFVKASADKVSLPILLIVEDNADMRAYIRRYFEDNFFIIEAIDGADGYEKATSQIPDIIISDVMMPNMDGNEFCEKVKTDERTSHIPVVLLTARASKESRMEGLETGADDFITKPFDGDELQVRVKNLIDQRKRLSAVLERKIQKSHSDTTIDFEDLGITSMDDKFLQKAKEVVDENLSNPDYSIEDFASDMALSRYQLHRKLKALINNSSTEFIRTIRLNYAIELLQNKAGTIAEIAYDSGFNNPTYFSKIFRQKFGMSPSEYQNYKE